MSLSAHERSKRPATKLAGPYGHPLHAALVPLPIGAFICAFALDLASRIADDGAGYGRASRVVLAIGLAGALVAAGFGLMDFSLLRERTTVNRIATVHMTLNLIVVALFGLSFAIRLGDGYDGVVSTGLIGLGAVALALLTVSGWLGGKMAYHYGVRVADEKTQAEGYVSSTRAGMGRPGTEPVTPREKVGARSR